MFLDRGLELSVVGSGDLILLLSIEEYHEARLAGERAVRQARHNVLRDVLCCAAEELHFDEIFIKSHEQVPVVLLHGVATSTPGKVHVNAEKLLVVFRLKLLLEMLHTFDSE